MKPAPALEALEVDSEDFPIANMENIRRVVEFEEAKRGSGVEPSKGDLIDAIKSELLVGEMEAHVLLEEFKPSPIDWAEWCGEEEFQAWFEER